MHLPQIILVIMYAISIIIIATQHGKPKEGNYNVIASLVSTGIMFGLLIWGGFFSH